MHVQRLFNKSPHWP